MAAAAPPLCWVLTEEEHPFKITAASDVWYATWKLTPEQVIGQTPKVLDGPGSDQVAGKMLMEQFAARGAATQRCKNMRSDGVLVEHTVSLVRAQGGLLAISTDMSQPEDDSGRQNDGHATLLDVSASLASSMHADRERRGAPGVTAADIAAASLDGACARLLVRAPPWCAALSRVCVSRKWRVRGVAQS